MRFINRFEPPANKATFKVIQIRFFPSRTVWDNAVDNKIKHASLELESGNHFPELWSVAEKIHFKILKVKFYV